MATNYKYPFITNDSETIRQYVSGLTVRFNDLNIESGFRRAANRMKDIVSKEVWQAAIDHFNSNNFELAEPTAEQARLDELVNLVRVPFANYAFYFHYIWLQLQISSDTIESGDKDKQPYRYQHLEAKDNLLETASEGVGELIDHLNQYLYEEWTGSDQYARTKAIVFDNYKDFEYHAGVSNAAAFYINASGIIRRIIKEHIKPRFKDYSAIEDENKLNSIKHFVAYKTVSETCLSFDYDNLPNPLRKDFYNELTSRSKDKKDDFFKENLSIKYARIADTFMNDLDINLAQEDKVPEDLPYDKFKSDIDETDKFATGL